ncbi:GNAT family N-acetyltransferase [bacterium SCSIO 12741]|nr:GNAT family N-acetyltransferase [bacterium SCSIO 12741]
MEILINPDWEEKDWSELQALYIAVEWQARERKDLEKATRMSSWVVVIKDQDRIIGFGRTMDDGCYYAVLVDVMIHPDYQGQGLGTKIVKLLREKLEGYLFITLSAAPEKNGFYEKLGWRQQSSAFIWPVSERQEKEHCVPVAKSK